MPCLSYKKNFYVKLEHFANADAKVDTDAKADADTVGSAKALPELPSGKLKMLNF